MRRFKHNAIWHGAVIPALLALYGGYCVVAQTAFLPSDGSSESLDLTGPSAIAMGIAWLGAALALHSKCFRGRVEPIWRVAELGFIAGLLMLAGGWIAAIAWAILDVLH